MKKLILLTLLFCGFVSAKYPINFKPEKSVSVHLSKHPSNLSGSLELDVDYSFISPYIKNFYSFANVKFPKVHVGFLNNSALDYEGYISAGFEMFSDKGRGVGYKHIYTHKKEAYSQVYLFYKVDRNILSTDYLVLYSGVSSKTDFNKVVLSKAWKLPSHIADNFVVGVYYNPDIFRKMSLSIESDFRDSVSLIIHF